MTVNSVRAASRPVSKQRSVTRIKTWMVLAAAMAFASLVGVFGYDYYSGRLGLIGSQFEIVQNGANRIIKVPPGGNLQGALEAANGGDIVELQAGGIYSGQINLPNKPLTDYVTIQSSAAGNLPADKRVTPA